MTIHVINPNSSQSVTDGIDAAIAAMRDRAPVPIACHTLTESVPGIETQAHVEGVVGPLLRRAEALSTDASALVVACFSDPGLAALREAHRIPVLGIAESAVLQALSMGQRFGVLSIGRGSIPRHLRYFGAMGVMDRFAADLPIDMGVTELADVGQTLERLTEVGTVLRDWHGADVLITGCAGMARYRSALEEALGLRVVDPCQAAVAAAIGRVALAACDERRKEGQ